MLPPSCRHSSLVSARPARTTSKTLSPATLLRASSPSSLVGRFAHEGWLSRSWCGWIGLRLTQRPKPIHPLSQPERSADGLTVRTFTPANRPRHIERLQTAHYGFQPMRQNRLARQAKCRAAPPPRRMASPHLIAACRSRLCLAFQRQAWCVQMLLGGRAFRLPALRSAFPKPQTLCISLETRAPKVKSIERTDKTPRCQLIRVETLIHADPFGVAVAGSQAFRACAPFGVTRAPSLGHRSKSSQADS